MVEMTDEEVKALIDRIGPSLSQPGSLNDYTYPPHFPEGRRDVCVVRRMAENGYSYGFDTLYLVWKDSRGALRHRELLNSRTTKNYIFVDGLSAHGNQVTIRWSARGYAKPEEGELRADIEG